MIRKGQSLLAFMVLAGGLVAALLIYAVLTQREDIVPGRTYRREIARTEKSNEQADEAKRLTERLLDAIRTAATEQRGW